MNNANNVQVPDEHRVPEDPDSPLAWLLMLVGAFTVKDDAGNLCTMMLGRRNNVAARMAKVLKQHPEWDLAALIGDNNE